MNLRRGVPSTSKTPELYVVRYSRNVTGFTQAAMAKAPKHALIVLSGLYTSIQHSRENHN